MSIVMVMLAVAVMMMMMMMMMRHLCIVLSFDILNLLNQFPSVSSPSQIDVFVLMRR